MPHISSKALCKRKKRSTLRHAAAQRQVPEDASIQDDSSPEADLLEASDIDSELQQAAEGEVEEEDTNDVNEEAASDAEAQPSGLTASQLQQADSVPALQQEGCGPVLQQPDTDYAHILEQAQSNSEAHQVGPQTDNRHRLQQAGHHAQVQQEAREPELQHATCAAELQHASRQSQAQQAETNPGLQQAMTAVEEQQPSDSSLVLVQASTDALLHLQGIDPELQQAEHEHELQQVEDDPDDEEADCQRWQQAGSALGLQCVDSDNVSELHGASNEAQQGAGTASDARQQLTTATPTLSSSSQHQVRKRVRMQDRTGHLS